MEKPKLELDPTIMVDAAMNMRTAAMNLIQLHNITVTNPEHQKAIDDLGGVIDSQQKMIAVLIEHYIRLAELLDQIYNKINEVMEESNASHPDQG